MDINAILESQYHAALSMLRQTVELCPPDVWDAPDHQNRFWRVAYHTLFYTDLYLSESETDFLTWAKHINEYHILGPIFWEDNREPNSGPPYTQDDVLEYHQHCVDAVGKKLGRLDLNAESGFHWLPFDKFELQLYNIRHIQHHTGQLAERVKQATGQGVVWVQTGTHT